MLGHEVLMSRYRARTAPSREDEQVQQGLGRARREVADAIRVARSTRTPRAERVGRELQRVMQAIDAVGVISPQTPSDPDLIPESDRVESFRERMAKERDERWSKRRAERAERRKRRRAAEVSDER